MAKVKKKKHKKTPSAFPGDYEVSIKFNNEHIPDSPFIVPIATLSDEARRLTVTSLQVRAHSSCRKSHINFFAQNIHERRSHEASG